MALINVGSINIDHVYQLAHFVTPGETISSNDYQAILGGKGANQSIAAAKAGMQVKHVGALAKQDATFLEAMQAAGVDCSHVALRNDIASGHAIIQVNEEGENAIFLFGGANQNITLKQVDEAVNNAQASDWLLIQNETNANSDVFRVAKQKGIKLAYNPAPMTAATKALPLDLLDLLVVNEIEAAQLTEQQALPDIINSLRHSFPNTQVVLTMGKAGVCYIFQEQQIELPAFRVDAVDTTAAGDTFVGYFLAALSQQLTIEEALRQACAASAISVTRHGAAPSIPSHQEVKHFLTTHTG